MAGLVHQVLDVFGGHLVVGEEDAFDFVHELDAGGYLLEIAPLQRLHQLHVEVVVLLPHR